VPSKFSVVCSNDFTLIQGYSENTALLKERQMSSHKSSRGLKRAYRSVFLKGESAEINRKMFVC
jgi:hypothetical protein